MERPWTWGRVDPLHARAVPSQGRGEKGKELKAWGGLCCHIQQRL